MNNRKRTNNNYLKKVKISEFLPTLINWLANSLTKSNYKETNYAQRVVSKILTVASSRGIAEAIRYTKELRLKFTKVILSIDPVDFKRRDQLWLPKILMPIVQHIENSKSYPFIRLIFSALYVSRMFRLDNDISFDTIEEEPRYSGTLDSIDEDLRQFLKILGVNPKHFGQVPKNLRFKEFHMSSKSGPNGHALWTSFFDFYGLTNNQKQAIKVVGGEKLFDLMLKFNQLVQQIPQFFVSRASRKGSPISRKIAKINDKEGKTREVAIGDYYSQAALLPLHKYLMKALSRINQDCTQDQIKHFYTLENSIGSSYHSIDLTAFTDRFPIDINHRMLSIWFGEEFADSWKILMIEEEFHWNAGTVRYRTGNPMGLYSSWASTTLAHHFLVYLAAKRCNLNWKRCRYMLLGDDIVIANDRLAGAYKEILSEWGIDFNPSKTHTSKYGFEFAKQIRLHDVNVSPFPIAALYERRTEAISSLGIILQEIQYKAWGSGLMSVLKSYYINVLRWPRPRFRAFRPTLRLIVSLLRYLQGEDILGNAIKGYVRSTLTVNGKKPKTKWSNMAHKRLFTHWVATKVVQALYIDSRERIVSKNTKGNLGDLATEMVVQITSLRDGGADCFDLIEAVPFLQVYGRAEEIYLKSFDNLYDYGMGSSQKDLRIHIGKVDIPLSDEGFYTRHRDVLIVQAMRASKIITKLLKATHEVDAYNGKLKFSVPWAKAIIPRT